MDWTERQAKAQQVLRVRELIARYEAAMTTVAYTKRKAADAEVERARWVDDTIEMLVNSGKAITPAKELAHRDPRHRELQAAVTEAQFNADLADRDARVLAFRIKLEQAQIEHLSLPVPLEEDDAEGQARSDRR